eukprot:jgi/Mesvir1/16004/Mv08304-RA.2
MMLRRASLIRFIIYSLLLTLLSTTTVADVTDKICPADMEKLQDYPTPLPPVPKGDENPGSAFLWRTAFPGTNVDGYTSVVVCASVTRQADDLSTRPMDLRASDEDGDFLVITTSNDAQSDDGSGGPPGGCPPRSGIGVYAWHAGGTCDSTSCCIATWGFIPAPGLPVTQAVCVDARAGSVTLRVLGTQVRGGQQEDMVETIWLTRRRSLGRGLELRRMLLPVFDTAREDEAEEASLIESWPAASDLPRVTVCGLRGPAVGTDQAARAIPSRVGDMPLGAREEALPGGGEYVSHLLALALLLETSLLSGLHAGAQLLLHATLAQAIGTLLGAGALLAIGAFLGRYSTCCVACHDSRHADSCKVGARQGAHVHGSGGSRDEGGHGGVVKVTLDTCGAEGVRFSFHEMGPLGCSVNDASTVGPDAPQVHSQPPAHQRVDVHGGVGTGGRRPPHEPMARGQGSHVHPYLPAWQRGEEAQEPLLAVRPAHNRDVHNRDVRGREVRCGDESGGGGGWVGAADGGAAPCPVPEPPWASRGMEGSASPAALWVRRQAGEGRDPSMVAQRVQCPHGMCVRGAAPCTCALCWEGRAAAASTDAAVGSRSVSEPLPPVPTVMSRLHYAGCTPLPGHPAGPVMGTHGLPLCGEGRGVCDLCSHGGGGDGYWQHGGGCRRQRSGLASEDEGGWGAAGMHLLSGDASMVGGQLASSSSPWLSISVLGSAAAGLVDQGTMTSPPGMGGEERQQSLGFQQGEPLQPFASSSSSYSGYGGLDGTTTRATGCAVVPVQPEATDEGGRYVGLKGRVDTTSPAPSDMPSTDTSSQCDTSSSQRDFSTSLLARLPSDNSWVIRDLSELLLEQRVDEGEYGVVYRARWRGCTVAAKVIKATGGHVRCAGWQQGQGGVLALGADHGQACSHVDGGRASGGHGGQGCRDSGMPMEHGGYMGPEHESTLAHLSLRGGAVDGPLLLSPPRLSRSSSDLSSGDGSEPVAASSSGDGLNVAAAADEATALEFQRELAIVTEYMPGGSLYALLHVRRKAPRGRRMVQMLADVAQGMAYLHAQRVIHRDLKSSNLLLDEGYRVKVADFGLSRVRAASRPHVSTATWGGTPGWMAPELLRGEDGAITEKADCYSFGVVMWEVLTRRVPWEGVSPWELIGKVGFGGESLPLVHGTGPPLVEALIQRCLEREPSRRPDFGEMADLLVAQLAEKEAGGGTQPAGLSIPGIPRRRTEQGRRDEPHRVPLDTGSSACTFPSDCFPIGALLPSVREEAAFSNKPETMMEGNKVARVRDCTANPACNEACAILSWHYADQRVLSHDGCLRPCNQRGAKFLQPSFGLEMMQTAGHGVTW